MTITRVTNQVSSLNAASVGLGNVTNESKATMFTNPVFTGTVSGVTATHVGLGNVTNESKATMFTNPTFTGTVSGVTATHVGLGNVTNESKATMFTNSTLTGSTQINSLGVGTTASGTAGEIRATNNVTAFFSSDSRLKENIQDVEDALGKVCSIGSKTFDWKDDVIQSLGGEDGYFIQKSDFGVIAQDVQAVFPQAVRTREDGTLAVDYEKLATLAFGAIKELTKRVEALENR